MTQVDTPWGIIWDSNNYNTQNVTQFKLMSVDGGEWIEPSTRYAFNTVGEHTVRYKMADGVDEIKGLWGPGVLFTDNYGSPMNIVKASIGEEIKTIGRQAFFDCRSLTSVTIQSSVTSIGNMTFQGCSSLTSVKIGNGVTSIGDNAFNNCSAVTYLDFEAPIEITTAITYSMKKLETVIIGDEVPSIGDASSQNYGIFASCTKLTSVTIGNSVTSIGSYAFYGCTNLTSVTIPSSVTSIGRDAFGYSGIHTVNSTIEGECILPQNLKIIGDFAFQACQFDTVKTNPNLLGTLNYCFGGTVVKHLYYDSPLLSISNFRGIGGSYMKITDSVVLSDNITSIDDSAFYNCSSLTSVNSTIEGECNIPSSVTSIGNYAFQGCSSLTSVTIPDSVTSIGIQTFQSCSSLTSVIIPNSVTNIGSSAFYGCSSLTSVTYNGTTEQWNAITKGSDWKGFVSSTCIVHCTDGDISIAEA